MTRIVSVNAWGGAVFDAFAEWLPTCAAEVICLQEVTRTPGLGGWTKFQDGERTLPQRANLFDDARTLLPHHQGIFLASDAGPVTDGDGQRHRQDFGVAMFIDERLPVIGHHATFVHGAFVDHDEWTVEDRPRIAQAVRMLDRAAARTFTVAHLHGLRDPAGKGDTPARLAQAKRLADLVTFAHTQEDLVVVCGDLNLLPDSETFAILGAIGLHDLVGTADTRTALYPKPTRHANYMLVSDPRQVDGFEISRSPVVSDHCPLILDIAPWSRSKDQTRTSTSG